MKLNKRMKDFADFYLETGNIYHSAIRAGYSENYAKTNASKLLENDSVKEYMGEILDEVNSRRIADITEVMEYLTKGLRQELEEEVVVVEGEGNGISSAKIMKKKIGIRDSNKCAELLGKRFGIFTDKLDLNGSVGVTIIDDIGE